MHAWQNWLAVGIALAIATNDAPAADRPPNVVFIYADDLGYGDLGCYGAPKIKTPHLDKLAADGLRFTDFYSCSPVCSPSRAGLLTGRYPVRSGLTSVLFPKSEDGIDDSEITLAEALKERGYATACVGKWHLGHLSKFLPTRHGFDRYFGIPYSNDMKPTPLVRDEKTLEEPVDQTTLTKRYTEEAVAFIAKADANKPFFLYMPHSLPHVPLAVSKEFKDRSAGGFYGDVVEEIDWSVGQVLKAIADRKIENGTIVVFSSDNGPWLVKGDHGGSAGPLRHGKGTTFEGGIRVPCIVRWPGKIKPGRVEKAPAIMLDWWPTFVTLAGGKIPADRTIDGKDLGPVLLGTGKRDGQDFFFHHHAQEWQAHRSGTWKIKLPFKGKVYGKPEEHGLLLFNLDDDPGEKNDLSAKHPDVVDRLKKQFTDFQAGLGKLPTPKK